MCTRSTANESLKRLFSAIVAVTCLAATAFAETKPNQSVHFRDIHRGGAAEIIGHFGLPIGQTVKLKGVLAKPSKVSNRSTLRVQAVNDETLPEYRGGGWPPLIQISNIDDLPAGVTIVLEGYEFAVWRGSAEKNWHLNVNFMATRVIAPKSLEFDRAPP